MSECSVHLTEDEAALYDRQIRLWGLDAQRRLRAAKVLLAGIRGLGAEVAKNIVLAGVQSLTLLDHTNVTEEDKCSNFLVEHTDIGQNRAIKALAKTQQLNPMVTVTADTDDIASKPDEYFSHFDVVCVLCSTIAVCSRINDICRRKSIQFFSGDVFGFYGYMFVDLGVHEYAQDVVRTIKHASGAGERESKADEKVTVVIKKVSEFLPLSTVISFDWSTESAKKKLKRTPITYFLIRVLLEFQQKFSRRPNLDGLSEDRRELLVIRDELMERMGLAPDTVSDLFTQSCFAELGPVCAIVGGVLAQEIIKAVSHKDMPHNNFFFYNGDDGTGMVDCIGQ